MTFSEKVMEARGQLRLTQKQFAELLGVSYTTVNRWEKGHNEPQFLERRNFDDLCKKNNIKFEE